MTGKENSHRPKKIGGSQRREGKMRETWKTRQTITREKENKGDEYRRAKGDSGKEKRESLSV